MSLRLLLTPRFLAVNVFQDVPGLIFARMTVLRNCYGYCLAGPKSIASPALHAEETNWAYAAFCCFWGLSFVATLLGCLTDQTLLQSCEVFAHTEILGCQSSLCNLVGFDTSGVAFRV